MIYFAGVFGLSIWAISASLMFYSSIFYQNFWQPLQQFWYRSCLASLGYFPPAVQQAIIVPLNRSGYSEAAIAFWLGRVYIMLLLTGVSGFLFMVAERGSTLLLASCLALLVTLWPYVRAGRKARKRQQEAVYALPLLLDTVALLLTTGVPLVAALQRSVSQEQQGVLHVELRLLLQNIRMGISLTRALEDFCYRLPTAEIRLFANLLAQASQQGNSLAPLLEQQAHIQREAIAAQIEEYAQEAPVRLLFPLALFIFPATILPFVAVIMAKLSYL